MAMFLNKKNKPEQNEEIEMDNLEKYNLIFKECFELEDQDLGENLVYQSVRNWDSVGHMQLISEIEDAFDIMLDTDDIIDFSSYDKGKEILKKYDIDL